MNAAKYVRRPGRPGLAREVVDVFTWDGTTEILGALADRYVTMTPALHPGEPAVLWTFRVFEDGHRTPYRITVHLGDRIVLRAPERDRGVMVCAPDEGWLDLNYEPAERVSIDGV